MVSSLCHTFYYTTPRLVSLGGDGDFSVTRSPVSQTEHSRSHFTQREYIEMMTNLTFGQGKYLIVNRVNL